MRQLGKEIQVDDCPDTHHLAQMKGPLTSAGNKCSFLIYSKHIHIGAVTQGLGWFDFHSAVKEDTSTGDCSAGNY